MSVELLSSREGRTLQTRLWNRLDQVRQISADLPNTTYRSVKTIYLVRRRLLSPIPSVANRVVNRES